jgi:hypothetical protein
MSDAGEDKDAWNRRSVGEASDSVKNTPYSFIGVHAHNGQESRISKSEQRGVQIGNTQT